MFNRPVRLSETDVNEGVPVELIVVPRKTVITGVNEAGVFDRIIVAPRLSPGMREDIVGGDPFTLKRVIHPSIGQLFDVDHYGYVGTGDQYPTYVIRARNNPTEKERDHFRKTAARRWCSYREDTTNVDYKRDIKIVCDGCEVDFVAVTFTNMDPIANLMRNVGSVAEVDGTFTFADGADLDEVVQLLLAYRGIFTRIVMP